MILTTSTRLAIKNLMRNLYHRRNMTDESKINYAVDRVCMEMESRKEKTYYIDDMTIVGVAVPIAFLFTTTHFPMTKDDKKYIAHYDDSICILASVNFGKLVKERVMIARPNGWGDNEDIIVGETVYSTATCRDMDGIYDTLYY